MREEPLVEIKNSEELRVWLRKQPREVSVAIAARAALRVLPIVQPARNAGFEGDFLAKIVLPVFRATGVAWTAAKFPAQATEFSAAYDANHVARAANRAATRDTGRAAGYAAAAARDANYAHAAATAYGGRASALWSAFSFDATGVEEGFSASVIAESMLWPQSHPDQLQSLWQEMKAGLLAAKQDWQVWTIWYDDRLEGHVRGEERELAYVRIEEALWNQGPAIVNAEIKRRIEEHQPPPPIAGAATQPFSDILAAWQPADAVPQTRRQYVPDVLFNPVALADTPPAPIENVPSAVSFGWTSKATITVVASPANWPAFPFKGGEKDHKDRLDACRVLATDVARSLRSGKWNARSDYAETLDQYVAYLPKHPEEGNFLLADAKARVIRSLFAAEQDFLPAPFAAELKVLLEQHIGLRAYYPATEEFYESVRSGHLETPLPIDAVEGFIQGVRDNTPILFEPNVAGTLENTAKPIPEISPVDLEAPKSGIAQPVPPPDPLGEVDPENARRFTLGSAVNALWKAVLSGDKADKTVERWSEVIATLGPKVIPILEWLRAVL